MKISAGLYRIDGVRGANAYVVETDDGLLVVDTGFSGNADRIVAAVRDIGHETTRRGVQLGRTPGSVDTASGH